MNQVRDKPLKVMLVGNYQLDAQESMERFAMLMASGLAARGVDVQILRPERILGSGSGSSGGLSKWLGYIDKYILFPPRLRKSSKWADIVHICDHSNAVYLDAIRDRAKPDHLPRSSSGAIWTG